MQSIIPSPPEDGADGLQANGEIEPGRPILDIEHIEAELIFEWEIRSSGNLREPGNTRSHGKQSSMVFFVLLHLPQLMRPWADEAHGSENNIEKLRQLIERISFDECADTRLPRIIFDLIERSFAHAPLFDQFLFIRDCFFEVRIVFIDTVLPLHVPEFINEKFLAILAESFILVHDGAGRILSLDGGGDEEHDR